MNVWCVRVRAGLHPMCLSLSPCSHISLTNWAKLLRVAGKEEKGGGQEEEEEGLISSCATTRHRVV